MNSEIAQLKPEKKRQVRTPRITARMRRGLLEMAEDKKLKPRERLAAYGRLLKTLNLAPEPKIKTQNRVKNAKQGLDAILRQVNAA